MLGKLKGLVQAKGVVLGYMVIVSPETGGYWFWVHKNVLPRWEVPSWAKRSAGSRSMWGVQCKGSRTMLGKHSPHQRVAQWNAGRPQG
jgi:hypothetical protein